LRYNALTAIQQGNTRKELEMGTSEVYEQLQTVLKTLQLAHKQLHKLDGMGHYTEQLEQLGSDLEQEAAELLTLDK
jgi:hypothetical protein